MEQFDPPPPPEAKQPAARIAPGSPGTLGVCGQGRSVPVVIAHRLPERAEVAEEDRVERRVLCPEAIICGIACQCPVGNPSGTLQELLVPGCLAEQCCRADHCALVI